MPNNDRHDRHPSLHSLLDRRVVGPNQTTALTITRQDLCGTDTTQDAYYASTWLPFTGRTQYLQRDGTLRDSNRDGWFETLSDVADAIKLANINY